MKKPKYRLFTVLSVVCLILGILMTTVGGHFSTVLTVAMEGSTTDKETAETTYADGLATDRLLEMKEMQPEFPDGMHLEQTCIGHPSVDVILSIIQKTVICQA